MDVGGKPSVPTSKDPCPKCRAKGEDRHGDNLVSYSDGHKYCFACRYYVPGDKSYKPPMIEDRKQHIVLPFDATPDIGLEGAQWLSKFDITKDEVHENFLQWSPSRSILIFPFYGEDTDDLLGWQGRYFAENRPKYYTLGQIDTVFWYKNLPVAQERGIVIVEDCVSAIRVGRMAGSIPLLGSYLSNIKRNNFKHVSDKLIFWLDWDKRGTAYNFAKQCELLGYSCRVIVTERDPKTYNDIEIKEILDSIEY